MKQKSSQNQACREWVSQAESSQMYDMMKVRCGEIRGYALYSCLSALQVLQGNEVEPRHESSSGNEDGFFIYNKLRV